MQNGKNTFRLSLIIHYSKWRQKTAIIDLEFFEYCKKVTTIKKEGLF